MKYLLLCLLISCAAQKTEELTVYTSRKEHLVKDLFKSFEKETKIKVNYRTGKAGALIQTIKTEGEKSPADVFMTVDAGNLWYAKDQGILTDVDSKILEYNVPKHLKDNDNHWFGLSLRARTIVYNTNKVKASDLKTYEDLGSAKWNGKLCLRTSKKVYNQSLVAMFIDEHGYDKSREIIENWVTNTQEIFSNDTSVLKAVAAGQCDVGIVNSYYFGRLVKEDPSLPIKLFWPNQVDSYGVHVNVSGAGIVKTSQNKKSAIKFLEWLSTDKAQAQLANVNYEYPVNSNVKADDFVRSWGEFKTNSKFELSKAGVLQKQAVKLMNEASYK